MLVEHGHDRDQGEQLEDGRDSKAVANPPIDCLYVYPTVSSEDQGNLDMQIQLPQIFVAQAQASRFSQVCRVYAPMYRQITDRRLTRRPCTPVPS